MADQATNPAVFGETSSEQPSTPEVNMSDNLNSDPLADKLAGIKNESGEQKYSNVEAALASINPANQHIANLEEETKELREELAKRKTAEEIVAQINPARQEAVPAEQPSASGLDEARVSELVGLQLKKTEAENIAKQNVSEVEAKLIAHFGDTAKAQEAYNKAAKEAGVGPEFLNSVAARSPKALFKFMNLEDAASGLPEKVSEGSSNLSNLSSNIEEAPTKSMMFGTSTKDLVSHWKEIGEDVRKELAQ